MNEVSANTRIGFYIVNSLNGEFVEAPENTMIKIPEWNNKGVFFIVALRNSSFFNPINENIVFISRDPLQTSYTFSIDSSLIVSNEISFKIPVNILQSVLGTFRDKWYFGAFTYFKDQSGTIEVDEDYLFESFLRSNANPLYVVACAQWSIGVLSLIFNLYCLAFRYSVSIILSRS